MSRTIGATAALLVVIVTMAGGALAGDQGDPEQSCDGSTYEMVECFKVKIAQWDKRMNVAYQASLKLALPKQQEQLRVAQRLWVQYRDANCLYWDLGEGTIARIQAGDCMYRLTRTRAEELEGAAETH